MIIRLAPSATKDLERAARFYERQRRGLGEIFIDSLIKDIEQLKSTAGIHSVVFGCHRALSRDFTYAIFYEMELEGALVLAVFDCRRSPQKLVKALRRRR